MSDMAPGDLELGERLADDVLAAMKRTFVGKDEVIDLLGVCLVAGEHLFILGPPGTAKTALVHELGQHLEGRTFDYLLTRFTEPNELFGPFDIRRLREGDLVTNTEGMLPEADLVFLDELLNANSAILNSLLMVLNERVFRRGRETRGLPLLMAVGASNRLPEDETIGALFDRFLLRVRCDNVPGEQLPEVLSAGWKLDLGLCRHEAGMTVDDARRLHALLPQVQLQEVRPAFVSLVQRVRHAGIPVSDRRAVKMQRLVAASALLCGRMDARASDLWVFRYIWDTEEQREVLAGIVKDHVRDVSSEPEAHPRARQAEAPDPDELARDVEHIARKLADSGLDSTERACLTDRLGELSSRCQWIRDEGKREYLHEKIEALWPKLRGA
jgi:MoxR-like ATPase